MHFFLFLNFGYCYKSKSYVDLPILHYNALDREIKSISIGIVISRTFSIQISFFCAACVFFVANVITNTVVFYILGILNGRLNTCCCPRFTIDLASMEFLGVKGSNGVMRNSEWGSIQWAIKCFSISFVMFGNLFAISLLSDSSHCVCASSFDRKT